MVTRLLRAWRGLPSTRQALLVFVLAIATVASVAMVREASFLSHLGATSATTAAADELQSQERSAHASSPHSTAAAAAAATAVLQQRNDTAALSPADEYARAMALPVHDDTQKQPPVLLHYTSRTKSFMVEQWKTSCGPLEVRFYDDDASEALVREHRPEFLTVYREQLSPVERADYFRYLVLFVHGGVYADSDVSCLKPVGQWLNAFGWNDYELSDLNFVGGIEFPWPQSHYDKTGPLPLQINQFVIASAKGSRMMARILQHVEKTIATIPRDKLDRTIERTGPAAFTRAILDEIARNGIAPPSPKLRGAKETRPPGYPPALLVPDQLEKQGQIVPMRGDSASEPFYKVLILPYRAFAFHAFHKYAAAPVLTRHHFHGSWRNGP
ncbi:hypothetical protein ATCC90586_009630 [Pythium insidiosum]|nr:hypothetical protein ATCC90586_009630 [Pythium insidiosum]